VTSKSALVWSRWLVLYVAVTVGISQIASIPELRVAHGVLVYLLLIVGASREGGRLLSAVMVVLSYLAVDWFLVPPRRQIGTPTELDFIILLGFLITATVISQLVVTLRQTATLATARAAEIERLGTERLILEREASRAQVLREAERLKNALIASLAHDLRSPITTLTMLAGPDSRLATDVALSRIRDEAQRLDEFLRTLGRFTAYGDADNLLVVESHVVEDLVGTAILSSESALSTHRVVVHPAAIEPLLMVRCDFTLTLQILGNLLVNAARYSPAGTQIDVSSSFVDGVVQITVSDRGPGLAPDEVEHVFQPLTRGTAARQSPTGTGMGLAIARTFALAQHGEVIYSPRVGGGADFRLELPSASQRQLLPQSLPPQYPAAETLVN